MKAKVLVVDDVAINRDILCEMLEENYTVLSAGNGKTALSLIRENGKDIVAVLLDLMMPELDGFGVLEVLKKEHWLDRFPVLVISGETSAESEEKCLRLGAADFVHKPFDEVLVKCRVSNAIDLYSYKNKLEQKVAKQTATLKKQNRALTLQAEKLEKFNETIVDILGTVVESRNLESGDHIKRVKGFTRILAEHAASLFPSLGLTSEAITVIVSASSLHDVGKIAIPDHILLKPGRFTPEEFEEMKKHTTLGCELLESIEDAWGDEYKKVCIDICRYHHERYDGRGYPDHLAGDDIPVSAQIVSIADVYDALVSKRVYKDAYGKDTAYHMILDGECGVFSPWLIDAFRDAKEDFESLLGNRVG